MPEDHEKEARIDSAPPSEVYANQTTVHASAYDVQLVLGLKGPADEPFRGVRVIMSWEHAKKTAGVLTDIVAAYEKNVGELSQASKEQLEAIVKEVES